VDRLRIDDSAWAYIPIQVRRRAREGRWRRVHARRMHPHAVRFASRYSPLDSGSCHILVDFSCFFSSPSFLRLAQLRYCTTFLASRTSVLMHRIVFLQCKLNTGCRVPISESRSVSRKKGGSGRSAGFSGLFGHQTGRGKTGGAGYASGSSNLLGLFSQP
jgi:hypothetical protein